MSPAMGSHTHYPIDGGAVEHSGPVEACDDPSLGPAESITIRDSSDDHPYHEACPKCWARFQWMRGRAERAESAMIRLREVAVETAKGDDRLVEYVDALIARVSEEP